MILKFEPSALRLQTAVTLRTVTLNKTAEEAEGVSPVMQRKIRMMPVICDNVS